MPVFSPKSNERLLTCHPEIQAVFREVVKYFDCTIYQGRRTPEEQRENVNKGVSKTLDSYHIPRTVDGEYDPTGLSDAVDAYPYPVKWPNENETTFARDLGRWYYFGGYVLGIAQRLNIPLVWGGDWDNDRQVNDQTFHDLAHFQRLIRGG